MDDREFITSLVDSLAWPGALVVLVISLRRQIRFLFETPLQRLKFGPGGAEFEWHRTERATAVAAASSVVQDAPPRDGLTDELRAVEPLIDRAPAVAVRQAFDVVERELRRIADDRQLELPYPNPDADGLIRAAYHGRVITKETGEALRGLVALRDLTNDDPAGTRTTPEKARDFIALVRPTLYALEANNARSRGGELQ